MGVPRVLLVEDDASIRRFVATALEDEPIELVQAATLAEADAALAAAPAALVIADLMLPDGSGLTLLEALAGRPGTTAVAFSAGLDARTRERLAAIGVAEVLHKPASLGALLACVRRVLDGAAAPAAAAPAATPGAGADRDAALAETYFGGDTALLDLYRAQCLAQFEIDARDGDQAVLRADLPGLRRLAHSLKSVLQMIGRDDGAALARGIEDLAAAGDATAFARWPALRARLAAAGRPGDDAG